MSTFTAGCQHQASAAWQALSAVNKAFEEARRTRRARSLGAKVGTGCLGVLIFWIPFMWTFLRLTIEALVYAAVVAYGLVMSALWGIGLAVDAIGDRVRSRKAARIK